MIVSIKDDVHGVPLITCVGVLDGGSEERKYTSGGVFMVTDKNFQFQITVYLSITKRLDGDVKRSTYFDTITPESMISNFDDNRDTIKDEVEFFLTKEINDFSGFNF